jgi:hypothetical protein
MVYTYYEATFNLRVVAQEDELPVVQDELGRSGWSTHSYLLTMMEKNKEEKFNYHRNQRNESQRSHEHLATAPRGLNGYFSRAELCEVKMSI